MNTMLRSLSIRSNNLGCFSNTPGSNLTVKPDMTHESYNLAEVSMRSLLWLSCLTVTDAPIESLPRSNWSMWRLPASSGR